MKDTSQKKGRANTDVNMFYSSLELLFIFGSSSQFYYSVSFLIVNLLFRTPSIKPFASGEVQGNSALLILQKQLSVINTF